MKPECLVAMALLSSACGGGDDGDGGSTPSFGGHDLASLSETCEGVAGLSGQAVLDQKVEQGSSTLGYVTASGDKVSPTELTLALTWPTAPVATCYPAYGEGVVVAEPRVGIAGVQMLLSTADGKFDETLDATAWLPSQSGAPGLPVVVGVTTLDALEGSWEPFPDYGQGGGTLSFVNRLSGAGPLQGNVTLSAASAAEIRAGVFRSGFAMAIWPSAP